jgi:hypothetical protein
MLHLEVRDES